jgi:hypothetical protein
MQIPDRNIDFMVGAYEQFNISMTGHVHRRLKKELHANKGE